MYLADISSKVIHIAFKVYILPVHSFPGNQTHNLDVAGVMLYGLSYKIIKVIYISYMKRVAMLTSHDTMCHAELTVTATYIIIKHRPIKNYMRLIQCL